MSASGTLSTRTKKLQSVPLRRVSLITWIDPTTEYPDDGDTVLLALADGEIWIGYRDADTWRDANADRLTIPVTHWADLPKHPNAHSDHEN